MKLASLLIRRSSLRIITDSIRKSSTNSQASSQILDDLKEFDNGRILTPTNNQQFKETLRITQKFCYYRKLYLECEEKPEFSLIVPYPYHRNYDFYEDQLIGVLYAILWGLHNGFRLIEVLNNNEGICGFLWKEQAIIKQNVVLVNLLRKMNRLNVNVSPFQAKILYKEYDFGLKQHPPPEVDTLNERTFLKTTRDSWDLIKEATDTNVLEIPNLQRRFAPAWMANKEEKETKKVKDTKDLSIPTEDPTTQNIKAIPLKKKPIRPRSRFRHLEDESKEVLNEEPKSQSLKARPAIETPETPKYKFDELCLKEDDEEENIEVRIAGEMILSEEDNLVNQQRTLQRRTKIKKFDRGDL